MTRLPQFTPPISERFLLSLTTSSMNHQVIISAIQSYTGITFKEIPKYKLDGFYYFLRDQIDFRPVGELASGSGLITAPYYVNCASLDFGARTFDTSGGAEGQLFLTS